jgi:phosphoribosylformylglycinamidine synthase
VAYLLKQAMSKVLFAKPGQRAPLTPSPWLKGIKTLTLPIAHGEGKFIAAPETLAELKKRGQIAGRYYNGEISKAQNLKPNPNGSLQDIAMVTSPNGKILGTMPHPERAVFFTQHPFWTLTKEKLTRANKPVPKFGPALEIFRNAVNYYK